jgi:hypothetical protein
MLERSRIHQIGEAGVGISVDTGRKRFEDNTVREVRGKRENISDRFLATVSVIFCALLFMIPMFENVEAMGDHTPVWKSYVRGDPINRDFICWIGSGIYVWADRDCNISW